MDLISIEIMEEVYFPFLNKKSRPISRILSSLIIYLMQNYSYILAAYPSTLSEQLLIVDILGVAPHRVYLVSLQPNCTCFLLHWSASFKGRVLPAMLLCGVRTFLSFLMKGAIRWPAGQS